MREEYHHVSALSLVLIATLIRPRTTVTDAAVSEARTVGRPVLQFIYDHSYQQHLTARALLGSFAAQMLAYVEMGTEACPTAVIHRILEFYGPSRPPPDVDDIIDEVLIPLTDLFHETGVVFLVDGIDECDPQEIRVILSGLRRLIKSRTHRLFISCRDEVNVQRRIPGSSRIWISAKDTAQDLERFVDDELDKRQRDRPISTNQHVLESVRREILKKAGGM